MIPAGEYEAVAFPIDDGSGRQVWAQFGESKQKATKQVVVNFEISAGEYQGTRLPWIGYFTENSWERTVRSLRICGFQGDDLMALPDQALQNRVSVTVEHDTNPNNGKTYARVAWVNQVGGAGMKLAAPMASNDLRVFAASMKSRIKSVGQVAPPKARPTTDAVDQSRSTKDEDDSQVPPPDDLIPF